MQTGMMGSGVKEKREAKMAMDLVTGAVGSLISKLGELLNKEYMLQRGVVKKIGSLIKELECAHAALCKVAGVPSDQLEEQDKIWAREVREASYDMEDVLDTFLVSAQDDRAEQTGHQSFFESLKMKMANIYNTVVSGPLKRRKIAVTIDDINKRLQEVIERHQRYTVDSFVSKPSPTSTVDPRLVAMYKEVTELIGIEKPSGELMAMLYLAQENEASNKEMKIVSIVGTGGLGKTTLAKAVYDNVEVDFQCRSFVSVGRHPDLKKVFRDILIKLDKEKYMDSNYRKLNEEQLINEIREYLRGKRYFIVIDDIWEIKSWEMIKLALVQYNCGIRRVIITTRNLEVARECSEVYELKPLPFDKSKKLFYTRIYGSEGKRHDSQLDEVSEKMLKKCDGVPLAIITMASLLVGKSREEWIEVCDSIIFRDKNKNHKQVSDTEWILSLSYYDLPPHLKTCLLYLSAFPEDCLINKDRLIWKWVAEGFIHNKEPGTSSFEIGEGYFNELINRSVIQVVEFEVSGRVSDCYLHDMVLDLLCVKSQEENFITISRNNGIAKVTSSSSRRVRRLVHQNKIEEQTHQDSLFGMDLQHVRTFIACYSIIADEVQSFQLLRVLDLEDCRGVVNLEHVEKLLHLRYLRICTTFTSELPEGIGALKFLQILDLGGYYNNVPSSLSQLTQLICLHLGVGKVPNGVIDKLTSLQELRIKYHDDMEGPSVKELGNLCKLRVLKCTFRKGFNESMQSALVEALANLHKIQHLTLVESLFRNMKLEKAIWDAVVLPRPLRYLMVLDMEFTVLPLCINPSDLPNLTNLYISVEDLDEQGLKNLGALPELRHLKLETGSTVTITVNDTNDGFFPKLRSCTFPKSATLFVPNEDSSVSFTIWGFDGDDGVTFGSQPATVRAPAIMPNLQVLHFSVDVQDLIYNNGSCDKLGLECLASLQKVTVRLYYDVGFAYKMKREEAALRHAIKAHPSRPTLKIEIYFLG